LVAALAAVGLGELIELNTGATPADATTQTAVAQYAASLAQQLPSLRYLVLAPAPTAKLAPAYVAALAAIRDAVHAVAPNVAVGPLFDGALTPLTTANTLGRSGLQADVLAFKPAPTQSQTSWATPNVAALTKAFGTLPPLVIDGAAPTADAVTSVQCSPNVAGVVFDHVADNPVTEVTSGLYDSAGAPKPAATAVAAAAVAAQRGAVVCPGIATPAATASVTYPSSVTSGTPAALQLGCVRDCLYVVTLVGADGKPVVATRGSLVGGAAPTTVTLPTTTLGQASYTLDVRLANRVNPGAAVTLTSPALPRG
jgi:hypothetical protein